MDWSRVKAAYMTEPHTTYQALANRFGVPCATLAAQIRRGGWAAERRTYQKDDEGRRKGQLERICFVTDRLLTKLEKAVEELDVQTVKRAKRVKEIEYHNEQRPDKPTKETVFDDETLVAQSGLIDRGGLKQISSALRDIKEVLRSDLDVREQEARVAKLERQLADEESAEGVEIRFDAETEAYAV